MTSFLTRRRVLRGAMAAAGLGLLAPAVGRAAATTLRDTGLLPAIGQRVSCSLHGFGVTLAVALPPPLPTLDFMGARTVEIGPGGADFVRYRVVDFRAVATHPLFGTITCRAPEREDTGSGTLRISGAQLADTWTQPMHVTFDRCGDAEGPYEFITLEPARWTAELIQFPPPLSETGSGASSTLQQSFHLGLPPEHHAGPDAPSCPLATPLPDGPSGAHAGFRDFALTQTPLR
ncbi:hypothetical protein [Streptomyces sp. NPDC054787]